jgi:hypothetical protein
MTDKKALELALKHRDKLMQLAEIIHSESILFGVAAIDSIINNYQPNKPKKNAKQSTTTTRRSNGNLRSK